jgi:RNA 2',3'-cyclic 3'-phosphodiesterase
MRLFAGIELDAATREACVRAQDQLRDAAFDARYEAAEKLHITLAFLGRVEAERVREVEDAIDTVAAATQPFSLTLDKLSAFPHERRPRVIFVGARAQGAPFRNLATALRGRYETLGFSFTDDAVAHVTIARHKGGSSRPLPMLDIVAAEVGIGAIVLFESVPEKQTTRYVVRHRAPLGRAATT